MERGVIDCSSRVPHACSLSECSVCLVWTGIVEGEGGFAYWQRVLEMVVCRAEGSDNLCLLCVLTRSRLCSKKDASTTHRNKLYIHIRTCECSNSYPVCFNHCSSDGPRSSLRLLTSPLCLSHSLSTHPLLLSKHWWVQGGLATPLSAYARSMGGAAMLSSTAVLPLTAIVTIIRPCPICFISRTYGLA